MTLPTTCDVVVIGGGPSGSTAAALLARRGYHVVLCDRARHPRYAVGESLIPDFWKYTDAAGVSEAIAAEGFVAKAGGLVTWDGDHRLLRFGDFGIERPALHVERDRFDEILLRHAGAQGVEVLEETPVRHVEIGDADGARCHVAGDAGEAAIDCRYVVDASGQNAVLGRQLGVRRINEAFRFLSVWGYYRGGRYLDAAGTARPMASATQIPPVTYVTSLPEFRHVGWCWHIPLRDSVSVGLVIPVKSARAPKRKGMTWETFFEEQCRALPVTGRLLEGAELSPGSVRTTRDFSYRSTRVAGPGYYLIGDAAGFIDPVFSIGVVLGLFTAHAAAWAIDRSLAAPARAESCRHLFTDQTQGRFELAYSLAVPRYEDSARIDAMAVRAMELASDTARELMHSASAVTGRSDNFRALAANARAERALRYRRIDELDL